MVYASQNMLESDPDTKTASFRKRKFGKTLTPMK